MSRLPRLPSSVSVRRGRFFPLASELALSSDAGLPSYMQAFNLLAKCGKLSIHNLRKGHSCRVVLFE
jgi:hypothetical protein